MVYDIESIVDNPAAKANNIEIVNLIKKYQNVQVKINKIIEVLNDCSILKKNYKDSINNIIKENPSMNNSDIKINGENLNTIMKRINNEPSINFNEKHEELIFEGNESHQYVIDQSKKDLSKILDDIEKLLNERKLIQTLMSKMDNLQQQLEEAQRDKTKANERNDEVSEYVHQLEKEKNSLCEKNKKQKSLIKNLKKSQKNENKLRKSLEEKSNELQILKEINDDLKEFVTELIKDLENVQGKLRESQNKEKVSKEEGNDKIIQNLKKENKELHSTLTRLKNDLNSIQKDLEKAINSERKENEEKNKLVNNVKEKEEEIKLLLTEKEQFQVALKQMEEKLSKELEKNNINNDPTVENLNKKIKEIQMLEKEKNDLQSSLTILKNENINIKKKLNKSENVRDMMQQEIDRINNINDHLNKDNMEFNKHIKELEEKVTSLKEERENLQSTLKQIKEELKGKENVIHLKEAEEEKIKILQKEHKEWKTLITELQNKNEKNIEEIESLINDKEELEEEMAILKYENESLKQELEEEKDEYSDNEIDELKEKLSFIKKNMNGALHDLNLYMNHLESEYPDSKNQSSIYERIYTLCMYSLNDLSQVNELNDSSLLNHHFKNFIDKISMVFDRIKQNCALTSLDSCFYANQSGELYDNNNTYDLIVKASCGCKYHNSCFKTFLAIHDYDVDNDKLNIPIEFKCPCCYKNSSIILSS